MTLVLFVGWPVTADIPGWPPDKRPGFGVCELPPGVAITLNPPLRMRQRLVRRGFTLPEARPERLLLGGQRTVRFRGLLWENRH